MIAWFALAVAVFDLLVLCALGMVGVVVSRKAKPILAMFVPPKPKPEPQGYGNTVPGMYGASGGVTGTSFVTIERVDEEDGPA